MRTRGCAPCRELNLQKADISSASEARRGPALASRDIEGTQFVARFLVSAPPLPRGYPVFGVIGDDFQNARKLPTGGRALGVEIEQPGVVVGQGGIGCAWLEEHRRARRQWIVGHDMRHEGR